MTGPFPYISPAYNHDVEPLEYDPDTAMDLLEDAGWYDRNDDGIADKDGSKLVIEFLYPGGNDASKIFGLKLQEAVADLGIKINLVEWSGRPSSSASRPASSRAATWPGSPSSSPIPSSCGTPSQGEYERGRATTPASRTPRSTS